MGSWLRRLFFGLGVALGVVAPQLAPELTARPYRMGPDLAVNIEVDGRPYVHRPSTHMYGARVMEMEHSMVYGRMRAALAYARANDVNQITLRTDADRIGTLRPGNTAYVLFTSGSTGRAKRTVLSVSAMASSAS